MTDDPFSYRNHEQYYDPTAHDALTNYETELKSHAPDEAELRLMRLIKTLKNAIDLMDYDLLNRIEVRDRRTGRIFR